MEPRLITLEPERQNALLKWWSLIEAGTLLACLEKARAHAIIEAADLQAKSVADDGNENFNKSAREKLNQAADFATTILTLKSFFPEGPFIDRIEL